MDYSSSPRVSETGCSTRAGLLAHLRCLALLLWATSWAGCGSDATLNASATPRASVPVRPSVLAALAAETKQPSPSAPQSTFRAGLDAGRDPFFPQSTRRATKASEGTATPQPPAVQHLKLLGIRPGTTRPLALINRTTFAPGEENDVTVVTGSETGKIEVRKINVRCLEIRQDSVLISIAGEQGVKELRIAQAK